ncbi:MAG: flavin reductase [Mesorhizobium sp.]|uniref:flavin reductase family protein n=1 Tax=Mesorhizobium sp. TaxID=1871066 RepID=UPI000FE58B6C|nr:MAG: flavin reductase [Mesorhizobium sp.]TIV68363.1 MAG: flavin reductase family protein [Mesorhizobium sp.]
MRHLAGAVSAVSGGVGVAATIITAHSLSVEPEVMVVSINLNSSTWVAINQHRHFCVNMLRADQMAIAERFAGRGGLKGSARYEGASWSALATGALAHEEALAVVDCTVEDTIVRHSHALLFSFWPVEQSTYRSARLWRSAPRQASLPSFTSRQRHIFLPPLLAASSSSRCVRCIRNRRLLNRCALRKRCVGHDHVLGLGHLFRGGEHGVGKIFARTNRLPRRLSDRTFRVCFRDIVRDGGQVDAGPDRLWLLYEATLLFDLDDKGSLLLHSALGAWGIAKVV